MPTIRDYLDAALSEAPEQSALRFKRSGRWHVWTFHDLAGQAGRVARMAVGPARLHPGRHTAALLAENSPEWVAAYLGLAAWGVAVAPIDPKLGENEIFHVLRDSEAKAVFLSARQVPKLAEILNGLPAVENVFVLGPDAPAPPFSSGAQWRCLAEEPLAVGTDIPLPRLRPKASDIASLIYTSGTTGLPKGAMLTHANFSADVEAALKVFDVCEDDDFLVVLPLHHAFGFLGNLMIPLVTRSQATFVENLKTVGDNLRECSPTVLLAVPLLVEKLYRRILSGVRAGIAGRTLDFLGITGPLKARTAAALGGKLRFVISGGAPCPREIILGLRRFGVPVIEGYGLTETAPVVSLGLPGDYRPGSVGPPLPGVEVCIRDANPAGVGEIAVRGPIVMKGYYRQPEATARVFDNGWFLTGDLGRFDEHGGLEITGRAKNVIVNREGKNIYPEEVEACIARHEFILENMVSGFRDENDIGERVGVIVVPDFEAIAARMHAAKAVRDPVALEKLMREAVKTACRDIAEYKRPRKVQVRTEPFEKTPTLKIKRYLYR